MNDEAKPVLRLHVTVQLVILAMFFLVLFAAIGYIYYLNSTTQKQTDSASTEREISNLRVGVMGDYTRQDVAPTKNYDEYAAIFRNMYSSLVSYTRDGKMVPDLATNWVNPNDTTWRFYLRKGVKFSNGKELEAADVKYTFDAIRKDKESQYNDYFYEIKAVNVIDSGTVEIKTDQPEPFLISKLTYLFIIPKGSKDVFVNNVFGTGPFVYNKTETVNGEKLVLDRNDLYWGTKPKVRRVTLHFYEDSQQMIQDYKNKKLDLMELDTQKNLVGTVGLSQTTHLFSPENGVQYIVLNMDKGAGKYISVKPNPLRDIRVREAMWEALDTDGLINVTLKGVATGADQVVAKQTFGYDPSIKRPEYNVANARELMKAAGLSKGFKIKIMSAGNNRDVADFVKSAWQKINIDVSLDLFSKVVGPEQIDRMINHDFATGIITWLEDTKDGQNTLMTIFGNNDQNMGAFQDKEFSKIMDILAMTSNQTERRTLIQNGLKIIRDRIPVIPLSTHKSSWFIRNDIKWYPQEIPEYYFAEAVGIL